MLIFKAECEAIWGRYWAWAPWESKNWSRLWVYDHLRRFIIPKNTKSVEIRIYDKPGRDRLKIEKVGTCWQIDGEGKYSGLSIIELIKSKGLTVAYVSFLTSE